MATILQSEYGYTARPSSLLNSIFVSTVNVAAKVLVSMASSSKADNTDKWKPIDHLRFMVMLMTWLTVWVLRLLVDHLPCSLSYSPDYAIDGSSSVGSFQLAPYSLSSPKALPCSPMDWMLHGGVDGAAVKALGRALTHVLALLNELPASSIKYQFTMAMAEKMMEDNARDGHAELLHVNQMAVSFSFARISYLLYHSHENTPSGYENDSWHIRAFKAIPLGSYITSCMKSIGACFNAVLSCFDNGPSHYQRRGLVVATGNGQDVHEDVIAEKLAQELLWITNKLRTFGDVAEALIQWSSASGLASLSLSATPRIQGCIVKISAMLFGELARKDLEISRQVKFRLLLLWLPLFCHASNGFTYPVLTSFQMTEIERAIEEVISCLPATEQEVILTNWVQEFALSASYWPNLQSSYDRWCQYTRQLVS